MHRGAAAAAGAAALALTALLAVALPPGALASSGDESLAFRRCLGQCLQSGCAPPQDQALTAAADSQGASSGTAAEQQHSQGQARRQRQQQRCSPLCTAAARGGEAVQAQVPAALVLWRWDCRADCSYLCMWQLEDASAGIAAAAAAGASGTAAAAAAELAAVHKYYGKWPFLRWAGMQEPASVLFSLLNLAVHAHCLAAYVRAWTALQRRRAAAAAAARLAALERTSTSAAGGGDASSASPSPPPALAPQPPSSQLVPPAAYPWAWAVVGGSLLSLNAWLWSAVFHSRDTRLTERLDYMSADALIAWNLFLTVARTTGLRSRAAMAALGGGIALALARHMHHMLFVLFDYGLNVKLCIAAGAVQSLLWLGWGLAQRGHRGRAALLAFVVLVNASMALEVLDFPPLWKVLDAHSLWHLATVVLTPLWYSFATADMEGWQQPAAGAAPALKAE